jgi:hypothetical protein
LTSSNKYQMTRAIQKTPTAKTFIGWIEVFYLMV